MSTTSTTAALARIESSLSSSTWTLSEREAYCDSVGAHPLYSRDDAVSTEDAAAARAAVANVEYDDADSPLVLGDEARAKGNAAFAAGGSFLAHAANHYADALRHADAAERAAGGVAGDAGSGATENDGVLASARLLRATVHANLAAVHLSRGKFISALECATASLRCGGGAKAAWRGAKAALELGRARAAEEFLDLADALGAAPGDLSAMRARAKSLRAAQAAHQLAYTSGTRARESRLQAVRAACAERRIATGPALFRGLRRTAAEPFVHSDGRVEEMHWPLTVLYPEHGQSDWVEDVGEASAVGDVVDILLARPPEWAPSLSAQKADVFFKARPCLPTPLERAWTQDALGDEPENDPRGAGWVRVPKDAPLLLVLAAEGYVVADVPILYIVETGTRFWTGMREDSGGTFLTLKLPDFGVP